MTSRQSSNPVLLIQKKRDGGELSKGEIDELVAGDVAGTIAHYQMSAMLMAMFLRGMSDAETVALMEAMLHSGRVPPPRPRPRPEVHKHTTRGVGAQISLCAP